MDFRLSIPIFLKEKLIEKKLSLKKLSEKSGIHYQTIKFIHQGIKPNPDFSTIIKLGDFFRCSIDELIGRDTKYWLRYHINCSFKTLSNEQVIDNVKKFILNKTNQDKITLSRLSIKIGFSIGLLSDFIREDRPIKSLRTNSICKIADFFDLSIDQMIGRVSLTKDNSDSNSTNNN